MKKLVDHGDHDYVYLRTDTIIIRNPEFRLIPKEVYACTDCGVGLEVYDLENPINVLETTDEPS